MTDRPERPDRPAHPARVRADIAKRRPLQRARLMSVYVAGATAYCAWAYPSQRLLITATPMGPDVADLVDRLGADDAVYLEEAATEVEEIDFAASFAAHLPAGAKPSAPSVAVPPSLPRNLMQLVRARSRARRRIV
jgi:hypothetical protein